MKKTLAGICNSCPLCRYSRNNPDSTIGKLVNWHGTWCPMWKAWQEVYGEGATAQVTVKETEPVTVAFLNMKGPYTQISDSFNRLYSWIEEKGYQPSGPPLGVYFNTPNVEPYDELTWELLSPIEIEEEVDSSVPGEKDLGIKKIKAIQVASITHKGPYENVGKTYEGLMAWIDQNGYKIVGPAQEVYVTNPEETAPEELLTEVMFPVQGL